jgi:uridylate kinase
MGKKYKRIILKVSGEALMGKKEFGIDSCVLSLYAEEIAEIHNMGIQIGIVIGGGNIYRGVENSSDGIDRVTGDHMGMLATMINGLALQGALEHRGIFTRLMTPIKMEEIAEPFIRRRAIRHLEKNRIVIFGAGTGNPYFTTDSAAALRAVEVKADVIIKGTRVDGVYDCDPEKFPDAFKFDEITYDDVIKKDLKVMDLTAITLCKENKMPIIVFNLNKADSLKKIIMGNRIGTLVYSKSGKKR